MQMLSVLAENVGGLPGSGLHMIELDPRLARFDKKGISQPVPLPPDVLKYIAQGGYDRPKAPAHRCRTH